MMWKLLFVFIGGGTGSISRFALNTWLSPASTQIPWATFSSNVLACLVAGFTAGILPILPENENTRLLILTGFCGGFSTFSTFSSENFNLVSDGKWGLMLIYTFASLLTCLTGVATGFWISHKFS